MGPRQYRTFAIALIAGCNFSHGKIGEQKDAPTEDGPVIDAPRIDAPMSDGPPDTPPSPTDTDSDGIVDSADNCPAIANTNQRNHDGDAKGDACDGCPHLASATDPDGDGDGVGDDCDPRSGTAGDARVLFEGFYDANAIAGWDEDGNGNWSVANGVLTQSSSTTSSTTHVIGPMITVPRAAVTAGARVIALGNSTNGFPPDTPHVSVSSGYAQNQSYWCSVVDEGNQDKVYATTLWPFNTNTPNKNWPGTFATNSELRLTSTLIGSTNTCAVVQGSTAETESGPIGPPAGGPRVATRTASASFDYLFVVSIGN